MKRVLSLMLTVAMLLTLLPASAAAYSEAYGSEVLLQDTVLHQGAALSRNVWWSDYYSQMRRESFVTYTPSASLKSVVSYGESVCQLTTVADAALSYEAQGYRVVAAINGDYYDTSTGAPLGIQVSGGRLLSGVGDYYAVGFRQDGSVVMGEPQLSIAASVPFGAQSFPVSSLNKGRSEYGGVAMLTYDYRTDHTTGTTTQGVTALCTVTFGQASIGGSMTVQVEQVVEGAEAIPLRQNQVALTVAAGGSAEGLAFVRGLVPGQSLQLTFSAAPGWETVTEAMGALHLLVENGAAQTGFEAGYAPRTAIGVKADGQVVLYTVDGRQTGHSMGASLKVLAQRMAELGCVTALCLDGGGSTTLAASTPDRAAAVAVNSPSDGKLRKVSNHLLLLAQARPTGMASSVYLAADSAYVLPGQSVELTANLVDSAWYPMQGQVQLTASAGQILGNTFVAPAQGGNVTITASAQGRSASIHLQVVDTPDEMHVLWDGKQMDAVTMFPGDKAQLTASILYKHLPFETTAADFVWSVDPALGSFDDKGLLTTGFMEGSGLVTVSKGSYVVSIPLTLDANSPFADTDGHWGGSFMAKLYHKGILSGVQEQDGLYAYPDKGVTRAEFAVLLARHLGINTADYAAAEVPFADMDKVGAWAADAVRAMYALGVVNGVANADGTQSFQPQSTLTRAQAVTMLGRTWTEGEVPADLTVFSDAGKIPAYALKHFGTMVGLGVIGGSYGKLDPDGPMTRAAICKVLSLMP